MILRSSDSDCDCQSEVGSDTCYPCCHWSITCCRSEHWPKVTPSKLGIWPKTGWLKILMTLRLFITLHITEVMNKLKRQWLWSIVWFSGRVPGLQHKTIHNVCSNDSSIVHSENPIMAYCCRQTEMTGLFGQIIHQTVLIKHMLLFCQEDFGQYWTSVSSAWQFALWPSPAKMVVVIITRVHCSVEGNVKFHVASGIAWIMQPPPSLLPWHFTLLRFHDDAQLCHITHHHIPSK